MSTTALSSSGQVETVIFPLTEKYQNSGKNPIRLAYQGERFEPPLNLLKNSLRHQFSGTKEYRFLINMLNTIKIKNAIDYKKLWQKIDQAPDLYIEEPDVWKQFQDFIIHAPNIYLVNKIYYGEYTVFQLMIESKDNNQKVYRFKSYAVKSQDNRLVLTNDLADDPGFKFIQLYSIYMSTDFIQNINPH
jgi:uncharacterized protein YbaA (DUF1428 family)